MVRGRITKFNTANAMKKTYSKIFDGVKTHSNHSELVLAHSSPKGVVYFLNHPPKL